MQPFHHGLPANVRAEIRAALAEVARRQAEAEVRAKRADERMDRAEERMDRAEERMDRVDRHMEKFDKRLEATRKLVKAGIKIVAQLARNQAADRKKFDYKMNALIEAQQRTEDRLTRFIASLQRPRSNGRR